MRTVKPGGTEKIAKPMNNYTQLPKYIEMAKPSKDIIDENLELEYLVFLSFGTGILLGLILERGLRD